MPTLTVEGLPPVEVEHGERLVLALEQDARRSAARLRRQRTVHDVPWLNIAGEPERMTVAERNLLAARGLTGVPLSCRIFDHDMTVQASSRLAGSGRPIRPHARAADPPRRRNGSIGSDR